MLTNILLRLYEPTALEPRQGGAGRAASKAQCAAANKIGSDKWKTIVEMSALGFL